jgi:hypothetical protein
MKLISPLGTEMLLFTAVPAGGANMINTVFSDTSSVSIGSGSSPYTGVFAPAMPLSTLTGENMSGRWTLQVADIVSGDNGRVEEWGLIFNSCSTEGSIEGIPEGTVEGQVEGRQKEKSFHIIVATAIITGELNWSNFFASSSSTILADIHVCFRNRRWFCYLFSGGPLNCFYSFADYNPADFKYNIYEILRLIQLFNSYSGYYHSDPTTEDGFAPGPGSISRNYKY